MSQHVLWPSTDRPGHTRISSLADSPAASYPALPPYIPSFPIPAREGCDLPTGLHLFLLSTQQHVPF